MTRARSTTRRLRDAQFAVHDQEHFSDKSAKFIGTATYADMLKSVVLCAALADNHDDDKYDQEWALNQDFPPSDGGEGDQDDEDDSSFQQEDLYDGPILYDEYDGMPLDPRDGSRLYDTFEEVHLYDYYDGTPLHPYDSSRLYTPRQP